MDNKVRNLERQIDNLISGAMVLRQQLLESFPERTYYDEILENDALVPTAVIAEDYGIETGDFYELLEGMEYVVRNGKDGWLPEREMVAYGYAYAGRPCCCQDSDCTIVGWTQKGRLFLYSELKAKGILPVMEEACCDGCE